MDDSANTPLKSLPKDARVTQQTFSKLTQISPMTLRRWAKSGYFVPATQVGNRKLYLLSQVTQARRLKDMSA